MGTFSFRSPVKTVTVVNEDTGETEVLKLAPVTLGLQRKIAALLERNAESDKDPAAVLEGVDGILGALFPEGHAHVTDAIPGSKLVEFIEYVMDAALKDEEQPAAKKKRPSRKRAKS